MAVKILHAADFHMDSAFDALSEEQAAQRRREQRQLLWQVAEAANGFGADVVLLSGDLLDSSASYYETQENLISALSHIQARVFISPGNHDYFCPKSPYSFLSFPENVHIFKTPFISSVILEELGCRIYGAGFNAPACPALMSGFSAEDDSLINIMAIHGATDGGVYNPISEDEIHASGLDYLALGHTHTFSGIKKAGKTYYAYPGCPEGRGFDETGQKGVITGVIDKGFSELEFLPLNGRQYKIFSVNLTDSSDASGTLLKALEGEDGGRDIARIILGGVYGGRIDCQALENLVAPKFFSVSVRNETHLGADMWESLGEDTLTGLFLTRLRKFYDSTDDDEKRRKIELAVKYGLAALENREEWRP